LRADEEALELDLDPELLLRLPLDTRLEALAGPDAAARRPPDVLGIGRLLDQRESSAGVEDEEGDVVPPSGRAAGERELLGADLAFPAERPRLAVALAQRCQHGLGQVHRTMVRSRACRSTRWRWRSAPPG